MRDSLGSRTSQVERSPMQQYVANVNNLEHRFAAIPELDGFLATVEQQDKVDLFVQVDLGPTGKISRFFGGPKRHLQPCFNLQKAGTWARLTFLDGAWSEHRASDPEQQTAPDAAALEALVDPGESLSTTECLTAARAFQAAREFLRQHGRRPSWLTYRYVK